jgi:hypothetical protein
MPKTLYALFHTCGELENAVLRFSAAGFRNTDISVLYPHSEGRRDPRASTRLQGGMPKMCSAAVLGGALGWLADGGVVALPGSGMFVAAGPILAVLVNGNLGNSPGIVTAALSALGISRQDAGCLAGRIARGALWMAIQCETVACADQAHEILKESGAENIASLAVPSPRVAETHEEEFAVST